VSCTGNVPTPNPAICAADRAGEAPLSAIVPLISHAWVTMLSPHVALGSLEPVPSNVRPLPVFAV
jgi:hypothetical protein